jgi:MFS family permease
MHIVAQGWLMYQMTDSPFALGLVGLTRAIPLLAFPLLGGVLADRVPRLRVLYVTQSTALLLAAGLATLTVMGVVQPWHILIFSFLNATVLAFDNPARQALLPALVSPADLMHANSLNRWSFNGAVLVGPALAAALLPLIGIGGVSISMP